MKNYVCLTFKNGAFTLLSGATNMIYHMEFFLEHLTNTFIWNISFVNLQILLQIVIQLKF